MKLFCVCFAMAGVVAPFAKLGAQQVYTAQDYALAESRLIYNTAPLVKHTVAGVSYLADGRVFYREPDRAGAHYFLADPKAGKVAAAFDTTRVARAISSAVKQTVAPADLGITAYTPEANGFAVISAYGTFHCDASGEHCRPDPPSPTPHILEPAQTLNAQASTAGVSATHTGGNAQRSQTPNANSTTQNTAPTRRSPGGPKAPFDLSPDQMLAAFIRDGNLWVRVEKTGEERQLTTDAQPDFGYATDNAGWTHSDAPILVWSPDSTKIATFQQDQRNTGYMYLVPVTNRHP